MGFLQGLSLTTAANRPSPLKRGVPTALFLWTTVLAWIGLFLFPLSLTLYSMAQQPGGFYYRLIVSLVNRLMILTYAVWLANTAWQTQSLRVSIA